MIRLFLILAFLFSTTTYANEIRFMTYNIGSMPIIFGKQLNEDVLRPNSERTEEIANIIQQWNRYPDINTPQIIAFEEAFDLKVRARLKEKLSSIYPYNSGDYGQKPLNAGSGLLLFSQYPILDISFHHYKNMMIGEETLANKGYIAAKLKYDDSHFFTVILTHLEAGGAIFYKEQSKDATTSVRRGEQMGEIAAEIFAIASTPPRGKENLKYIKTFVMGDFNTSLDDERRQKSISTGLSNNGFEEGQVKYPGQFWLFSLVENTVPQNFLEVRVLPKHKGEGKQVSHELMKQAIQENKFTGTTFVSEELTEHKKNSTHPNRQQTENKIIDGVFVTHAGMDGDLQTNIVSLNEYTHYTNVLSDHLAICGRFTFIP
jgi:hypothetical protein